MRKGREIIDATNQTGSRLHWDRRLSSDVLVIKVSTPFRNTKNIVQTTKEAPIESKKVILGDANNGGKETG